MAMKKLAPDIQSLISASTHICNYKSAVEELVYNSLDAEATSIAIRVNIDENSLQVIDNGTGVAKNDFKLLGQRYATSKCVDISTLKSAPNKYGFQGQSLASIIQVSKRLNVTSRCADTEETWTKEFYKGKERKLAKTIVRPSKGTTVEIKGFLHNLHIQKNSINSLTELNDIKTFLQQLSLVHNNMSLSLRDDSKNDIIFKLHKNRDIYQILSTVFGVEKRDVQELKVEKNDYKVTAIIANRDKNINQYHWVYLNGKFINSSKISKLINEYLIKFLGLKNTKKKTKLKNNLAEPEDITSKKTIPMYFIFITCPYYDYNINTTSLEFKDWEHLKKMIEKLVKFYVGDARLKEIVTTKVIENKANKKEDETREQVKKIMERILRSNSKKPRVSQMQNGVKGKIIKRKSKKKVPKLTITKLIRQEISKDNNVPANIVSDNTGNVPSQVAAKFNHDKNKVSDGNRDTIRETKDKSIKKYMKHNKTHFDNLKLMKHKEKSNTLQNICKDNREEKSNSRKPMKIANYVVKNKQNNKKKTKIIKAKKKLQINNKKIKFIRKKTLEDPILNKFKTESDSLKQRCNVLARNVENLISYKKKRKRKIFVNETVHYSTVVKDNKNVSVRKKVDEIVIHDFIPLPPRFKSCSTIDNRVWKKMPNKSCKTSYDLIQTILKSQQKCTTSDTKAINDISSRLSNYSKHTEIYNDQKDETNDLQNREFENPNYYETLSEVHKLTYDSHHYKSCSSHDNRSNNQSDFDISNANNHIEFTETMNRNKHFITKQSRDNFIAPNLQLFKNKIGNGQKNTLLSTRQPHKCKNPLFANLKYNFRNDLWQQENSFTIDYIDSNECKYNNSYLDRRNTRVNSDSPQHEEYELIQSNTVCGGTYTIISNTSQTSLGDGDYQFQQSNHISLAQRTYCIRTSNQCRINYTEGNVDFINNGEGNEELEVRNYVSERNNVNTVIASKSQNSMLNHSDIEPIDICETTMKSNQDVQEDNSIRKINFNDSVFKYDFSIDSVLFDRDAYAHIEHIEDGQTKNNNENYSQYFCEKKNNITEAENVLLEIDEVIGIDKASNRDKIKENEHFNLKTRPRFVPKGLSPIFVNCQTTKVCDYNLEKDYYEDPIYNQFVNKVQLQSEIFEPNIQHVKELKTKDIARVNKRLDKENASLVFNGESLEQAIVLRQVDCKFIATKIKGKCHQSTDVSEYLVLFDQHAVHERIRLETNLAEYFIEDNWKSVSLDEVPLKLTKEEVIYLHNYRDKFTQFGLQWIILSNEEVKITGIPEAILGKHPRQVDVVMKAVKNLISEEVQAIKTQKGCVSLYPKSIMDLVFSEACRYAIKFGDKLSTHECMELLKSLSKCKTPFQCAHGRPVMAVLMSIESNPNRRQFKLVTPKLRQFITSLK